MLRGSAELDRLRSSQEESIVSYLVFLHPLCLLVVLGTELLVFPLSLHFLAKSLVAPTLFFLLWFA